MNILAGRVWTKITQRSCLMMANKYNRRLLRISAYSFSINESVISKLNENSSISEDEKQEIIKLYNNIDMDQLRDANPKLFEYLYFDPTKIMDFKSSIAEQAELKAQTAIDTEAMDAATTASQSTPKVYTLPLFWKWLTPVFAVTSGWLLSIQAATNIPWLPFLIICGVGVRLIMAPLMIRQMTYINKMSVASPDMRIVGKLFKHIERRMPTKLLWTFKRISLTKFYFYNLFQIPVFIIMVFSIRKICFEHEELRDKGILWFKDLNEADPYLILPICAVMLNYINLGRGITKDNEHWFINRFRSFFQVLQFMHLPWTHAWPAGTFIYWIASSLMVFIQVTITRHPKIMNYINPAFFYNYTKMFGERSSKSHENYVERLLYSEDTKLKSYTRDDFVLEDLEYELKQFMNMQRLRKVKITKEDIKDSVSSKVDNLRQAKTTQY